MPTLRSSSRHELVLILCCDVCLFCFAFDMDALLQHFRHDFHCFLASYFGSMIFRCALKRSVFVCGVWKCFFGWHEGFCSRGLEGPCHGSRIFKVRLGIWSMDLCLLGMSVSKRVLSAGHGVSCEVHFLVFVCCSVSVCIPGLILARPQSSPYEIVKPIIRLYFFVCLSWCPHLGNPPNNY